MNYSKHIFSGHFGNCHCQGIAVDEAHGYIYYSFTTLLVKTDMQGNLIGTVDGLTGHLGCIDFCEKDGRVYGSLEYKCDSIGRGIAATLGVQQENRTAFYCAIFDVDRIDRPGMSAERDDVMRAVYLGEVVADYVATALVEGETYLHRYGCSGIDGTAFGPLCGQTGGKEYLHIAYGIYGEPNRPDNDYQVILCYDADGWWDTYARPLNQAAMHKSGPDTYYEKFFVYTGNTTWGVQNLEYDAYTHSYMMMVYCGQKEEFPNYPMFLVDATIPPRDSTHRVTGEPIRELTLKKVGHRQGEVFGNWFPYGSTGTYATGTGYYYFSRHGGDAEGQYTNLHLYRATDDPCDPFAIAE
ncbi:MAG: hypothetical protein IJY20_01575 [Clostridia bacterium]|nr:hypothetical protein [Clostridia bacterium]